MDAGTKAMQTTVDDDSFAVLDAVARGFIDAGAVSVLAQLRTPAGERSAAYGVRDLRTREPARWTDRFKVASITKSMTAAVVLRLVDLGMVGLDDPANGLVRAFHTVLLPPDLISVRQLLSHTSGLPDYSARLYSGEDFRPMLSRSLTPDDALALCEGLPWDAERIGEFHYGNAAYMALGAVVETLHGRPFPAVLQEEVFDRLRLAHTTTGRVAPGSAPDVLHGYVTLHGSTVDVTDNTSSAGSPSGGAVTTLNDLNDFYAGLLQGRLVSSYSLADMKRQSSEQPYGLGLWLWDDPRTGVRRYGGQGQFWESITVTLSDEHAEHQAAMVVVPPPMPTEREDPAADEARSAIRAQIGRALNGALDAASGQRTSPRPRADPCTSTPAPLRSSTQARTHANRGGTNACHR